MISFLKRNDVEFLCEEEDFSVIPPPIPARKILPEWYKHLPPKIRKEDKLNNSTIKRCAPFLDAMTLGWIIPLAADVEIVTDDKYQLAFKHSFYKNMVESHGATQVNADNHPNPHSPKPPMKFLNYWYIKIPKGYSALFIPPLNRADPRFECISGCVDDGYMGNENLEYINFPFFFHQPNYTGIVKAGTPLVQMIVFPRDDKAIKSCNKVKARPIKSKEKDLVNRTRRRRSSHESYYRDKLWNRK
jgi:hypothetical protein